MAVRWRADLVSHNAKGLVLQIEHKAFWSKQWLFLHCWCSLKSLGKCCPLWTEVLLTVRQCRHKSRVILHVTEVDDWRHLLRIWSEYSSEDHQRRLHRFCNSKNARRFDLRDDSRIYTKQWSIAFYQNQVIYILKSFILDMGSPIFVLVNTVSIRI